MTTTTTRRATRAAWPISYLVAVLVDVALLVLINVSPGWRALPFLTEQAGTVVVVFDIALALGVVVNLVCLTRPARTVFLLGDVVTTASALVVLGWTWAVFPFHFADPATDWASVVEFALPSVVVVVGIAFVVQLTALVRALVDHAGRSR